MRVLHLINGEHYAGAERVQDLLAESLPEFGYEVDFACLKPDQFPSQRRYRDAQIHDVSMSSRIDLKVARRVAAIAESGDYRIIHTHGPRSALVGRFAASLSGRPMVHHVHSPTSRDSTRSFWNRVNARMEVFGVKKVAHVIVVSESLRRHTEEAGFPSCPVSVVHNGVSRPSSQRSSILPEGSWTLGTVALFRPRKGVEILLEALASLTRDQVATQLVAVGDFETPEYEREIKSTATDLGLEGLVTWTGFTDRVADRLSQMDIFVLPSLFGEGLPMVILEAMAAGVPIVATDVEGISEAIRADTDGLIVPAGDPQAIAAAVRSLVRGEADWSSLRSSAMRRYEEHFTDRAMATGVAAVYREILERDS